MIFEKAWYKARCYNGGMKHRFIPVFETTREGGTAFELATIKKKYVKHVCMWCGESKGLSDYESAD